MDWQNLGKKIMGLGIPLLGTVLAGPAGGAVGALIADALGVDNDPAAIATAIDADPEATSKLTELQIKHKERLAEITLEHARIEGQERMNALQEINLTMRAELQAEHWPQWLWRPAWGLISAIAFLVVCIFVCILAYQGIVGKDPAAISMIPGLVMAFTTLFGVPLAVCGITAWGRNQLKVQQLGLDSANGK